MPKRVVWAFVCCIGILSLSAYPVLAERLESDSYVIQFGNFNIGSGERDSTSYKVTDTSGQTAAGPFGEYGSTDYFIGSGFQYIYQIQRFSFSLSKTNIDLGVLTAGSHNTDSHTATITTRGAGGYQVFVYEEQPLTSVASAEIIPNTTCDTGSCTYTTAGVWTNTAVGGFGYSVTGDNVNPDFIDSTYFKPFADASVSEPMEMIMSSTDLATQESSTITYKAGITGVQAAGQYATNVVFIAVPGY